MGHLLPDKQLAWLPMVSVLHQAPKRERKGREKGREWKRTDRGRMTAEGSNRDKEEQDRGSTERKEQVRAHVRDGAGESESTEVCGKWRCVCAIKCGSAYARERLRECVHMAGTRVRRRKRRVRKGG